MTVEKLEKANSIMEKIKKIKEFKIAFCCYSNSNIILSKYIKYPELGEPIHKESKLNLEEFLELQDFISGYLSDKITELEKQLEEL